MTDQKAMLMIIDVQRGFINEHTGHIVAKVEALQQDFSRLVVTRFINRADSPHRRFLEWSAFAPHSDDTELAFAPRADAFVMDKTTYTATTPDVIAGLQQSGVGEVHLCGIATDNCILKTAVDLFEAGIRPVVLTDACASHAGPQYHEAGLTLLKRFIGPKQLV